MSRAPQVAVVGWPQESNSLLVDAWRRLGVACELLRPADAVARLGPSDVAVVRLDVLPTLDGVERGLDAVEELARRGVRVLNRPEPLLRAHDKLLAASVLEAAGVPTPRTAHVTSPDETPPLAPPVVVKPRFGSWGADVFRCESEAELARVLSDVARRPWFVKQGALVQELLPPVGYDLRLIVAGGRVVGGVERVAAKGEWRTNTALGGSRRPAAPGDAARSLGLRAAAATGMDFVGVDLFPVGDVHVVLELNGAVEFDSAYDLLGEDVYAAALDAVALPRASALAPAG